MFKKKGSKKMSSGKFGGGKRSGTKNALIVVVLASAIIGIIIVGQSTGVFSGLFGTSYRVDNYYYGEGVSEITSGWNLEVHIGLPLVTGSWTDPFGDVWQVSMTSDNHWHAAFNSTYWIEIIECYFLISNVILNRGFGDEATLYQGQILNFNMLHVNAIRAYVNPNTYNMISAYIISGQFTVLVHVGIFENTITNTVNAGWHNLNIARDPIVVQNTGVTTYAFENLIETLFDG